MKNVILVLGSDTVPPHSFASILTGATVAASTSVVPLTIETKYYSAQLRVWLSLSRSDDAVQVDEFALACGDAVDGVVLLFDSRRKESLCELQNWWLFIEQIQPGVALCVDVGALDHRGDVSALDQTSDPRESLKDAKRLCLEYHAELVCIDPDDENEDPLQRIRDALYANTWDGLVLNTAAGASVDPEPQAAPTTIDWSAAAAEFGDSEDDYLDLKAVLARENDSLADMLAEMDVGEMDDAEFGDFMAGGKGVSDVPKGSELDFDLPEFDELDPTNLNASEEMKNLRSTLFGEMDDDDFFEKAISQIKNLRDSANGLEDAKRRDMAKKLALALLMDEEEPE
ncbi:hypothetical protein HDU98_002507 [Podochytrium sp. JEL0797]|nr:hypothetical protein HDU98_002507 [Podochytrium sp. JEL0797]